MSRTASRSNLPDRSAASAGLHYVTDEGPGIRREMGPLGFRYRRADGRPVRREADLKRIRTLAIPPAWTDVWISPDPRGHLQATGRDARGRKQYRYHSQWRAHRDTNKFDRLQAFAEVLPRLRARIAADLARPGLTREKVLATVVQLLEKSLIRVGNEEYAKANGSFGLTTLRDRHVAVKGSTLRFEFRGKSGKEHSVEVSDRRLARIVKQCRDLPGQKLFQYLDENKERQSVSSEDVNAYLRETTGEDFSAKDFRTWGGTVLALSALLEVGSCESEREANKAVVEAIKHVSGQLGNRPAICRKYYVHPVVIQSFLEGTLRDTLEDAVEDSPADESNGLRRLEAQVLRLLKGRAEAA
jgi:DNA topoisomerase-1